MNTCVFCNFNLIKENTIATVDGFHITATLGQITDGGYLLILPMSHVDCIGAMSARQLKLFNSLVENASDFLSGEFDSDVQIFEHGVVGQTIPHAHLHLVPSVVDLTSQVRKDFPTSEFQSVNSFEGLRRQYLKRKTPYLFWSQGQQLNVCWNPPAEPMYFRLVLARLLNVPERGNWRQMDASLDKDLRGNTIERMTPYFIP